MQKRLTLNFLAVATSATLLFSGCAELQQVAQIALEQTENGAVTSGDVASGLKQALIKGANSSTSMLAKTNGYLKDEAVKILLPEEANIITQNISKIPGGQKLLDEVISNINQAASDAASQAAPILVNSIKSMTITDAFNILKGEDNAATNYLHKTSYSSLHNLYKPIIEKSLKKDLTAGISAQESWDKLTSSWNTVANSMVGQISGFTPVNTDLSSHLTTKALDGLFLKVEATEKDIRVNQGARTTALLKKVFALQD